MAGYFGRVLVLSRFAINSLKEKNKSARFEKQLFLTDSVFSVTRCSKRPSRLPQHLPHTLQGAFSYSCISLKFFWHSYLGNCTDELRTKILERFCLSHAGGARRATGWVFCFAANFPESCCPFFHFWEGKLWQHCGSGAEFTVVWHIPFLLEKKRKKHRSLDKSGLFAASPCWPKPALAA